jgi:SAM-dependent methyltransferase
LDLRDRRVLDIGCRDGLFSFEAEKLGAKEVIGIDNNLSTGAVEFLIPYFNSKVKMHELNLLGLKPEDFGLFDIIIFSGVLYHLRYPFWSLKIIRDVLQTGGYLIIETAIFRDKNKYAMLHCPVGSESPYEGSSCSFFNMKGLNDTLSSLGFTVENVNILNDRFQNRRPDAKELLRFLLKRRKVIDRATLICRKVEQTPWKSLDNYWNGTHKTRGWR